MKYILLENAFASWREAILLCDSIFSGFATLKYQKHFVTALHNSVELFLKQIMLNQGNHNIAFVRNTKSKTGAQLALNYYGCTDLNEFFTQITPEEIDKFASIDFKDLIERHKKIINSVMPQNSFNSELKLLQNLRNNETHFMISKTTFLREEDFVTLYNFMIDFYKVIESFDLLPFWGEAQNENKYLVFKHNKLNAFSYLNAVKSNKLAIDVVSILNGSIEYGQPGATSYEIADNFCRDNEVYENRFEKIWTLLEMLINSSKIDYDEEIEELPEEVGLLGISPNVYYVMNVSL